MVISFLRKALLWFIPMIMLFLIQHETLSKTNKSFMGKIQGYALPNTSNNLSAKKDKDIALLGVFASSDEPVSQPLYIKFAYTAFNKFYMGIVIYNDSDSDKDVVVTFELSGPRRGKEEDEVTIPKNSTYIAYIYDILGRPGIYTFTGGIKDNESSKMRFILEE
jgi:hypothetical protein